MGAIELWKTSISSQFPCSVLFGLEGCDGIFPNTLMVTHLLPSLQPAPVSNPKLCVDSSCPSGCEAPRGRHFFRNVALTIEGRDKKTLCLSPLSAHFSLGFHSIPNPDLRLCLAFCSASAVYSLSGRFRGTCIRMGRAKASSGSSHWALLEPVFGALFLGCH